MVRDNLFTILKNYMIISTLIVNSLKFQIVVMIPCWDIDLVNDKLGNAG